MERLVVITGLSGSGKSLAARTFEDLIEGTFRVFFDYLARDRGAFEVLRSNAGAIRVRMDTPEIVAGFDELIIFDRQFNDGAGNARRDLDYIGPDLTG